VAEPTTFIRTEEQTMLAGTLRDLLSATSDMDTTRELSLSTDALDRRVWDAISEMGLVGLVVPAGFGGSDSTFTDLAVVFEELGRAVVAVPLVSTTVASIAILDAGSDEQRARWLPDLASGASIGTLAVFEDTHGGGASTPTTTAAPHGDGWKLVGTKRFVTDGPNADLFVVSATVDGEVALFVVPAETDGVTVSTVPALDATRPLADIAFDVDLDAGSRLGGGSVTAGDAVSRALDVGVAMLANEQVGVAHRCLEMSVEYAKNRYQFGRAIGSFQAIKHRCADMLVAVEHARSAAWHAASTLDDPDEALIAVPLAKSVCSDAAVRVSGDTIQVFGGIGFTWEHDAHLYFKRAKADSLLFGSVADHRDRLADAIGV
jgi:alkylation response protein AidB-like acyl-CoA dehydrogenase